jgi:hypothetical protein
VKHLERALDYTFRIEQSQLEQFDADHRLLHLHPGVLDDALDEATRLAAVDELLDSLEAALEADAVPVAEIERTALNLRTTVELESVTKTRSRLPGRSGVISGPSISGYRPESMFERNVAGVVSKLKKGQALSVADTVPVLVVEMSQSELTTELIDTNYYRPRFLETIETELSDFRGYGVVVFAEFSNWQRPLRMHFTVVEDAIVDAAALQTAFPP